MYVDFNIPSQILVSTDDTVANIVLGESGNTWSSNEPTPTDDGGFAPQKSETTKESKKYKRKLSNWERRDNLLKFAETINGCGMVVPPTFSASVCTSSDCEDGRGMTKTRSLPDIGSWLRSKRLHKYGHCFQGVSWDEMFQFTESDLADKGVYTVGARGRLIKGINNLKEFL
jgi:hypothetical protein